MKQNVYYKVRIRFGGGPSPGLKKKVLERIAMLLDDQGNDGLYVLPGVEHHYVSELPKRRKRRYATIMVPRPGGPSLTGVEEVKVRGRVVR